MQSAAMPKRHPTKMGSDLMNDWKQESRRLYFIEQKSINEVSEAVQKSRKSVSGYLKTLHCFKMEKERRKASNAKKRKDYQREWDRKNRNSNYMTITGDTLRREHELAIIELSRERYYG